MVLRFEDNENTLSSMLQKFRLYGFSNRNPNLPQLQKTVNNVFCSCGNIIRLISAISDSRDKGSSFSLSL